MQYAQVFNHLCQYAGYHADTDARKQDRFRRGLNTKLKEWLNLVRADNFNENWSIWPLPKRIVSQPTGQKRNERHPWDSQIRNRQGIGWSRILLPKPHPETFYETDG
jgi:hypothetical protein